MFSNSIYLIITQVVSLLSPLIVYPIYYKVFGASIMGGIITKFLVVDTILLISNYGFDITAYREVSQASTKVLQSKIITKVIMTRLLIAVPVYVLIACIYYNGAHYFFIILCYIVFSTLVNPWFFIATENAKNMCIITLLSKVFFVLFVFYMIRLGKSDIWFFYSLTFEKLICAVLLSILFFKSGYTYIRSSLNEIFRTLRQDFTFFLSRIVVTLYIRTNTISLGLHQQNVGVAIFDFSNKLLSAMKVPSNAITQVSYPKMVQRFNFKFSVKLISVILSISAIGLIFVYYSLEYVIYYLTKGELATYSQEVFMILLSLPISSVSSFLATSVLAANYKNIEFKRSIFIPTSIYFILLTLFIFIEKVNLNNMIFLYLFTEIFILLIRMYYVVRFYYDNKKDNI